MPEQICVRGGAARVGHPVPDVRSAIEPAVPRSCGLGIERLDGILVTRPQRSCGELPITRGELTNQSAKLRANARLLEADAPIQALRRRVQPRQRIPERSEFPQRVLHHPGRRALPAQMRRRRHAGDPGHLHRAPTPELALVDEHQTTGDLSVFPLQPDVLVACVGQHRGHVGRVHPEAVGHERREAVHLILTRWAAESLVRRAAHGISSLARKVRPGSTTDSHVSTPAPRSTKRPDSDTWALSVRARQSTRMYSRTPFRS